MPRLQRLKFDIRLEDFCGGEFIAEEDLALGHLPSLENVWARILPRGEEETNKQDAVVMKVKEALRQLMMFGTSSETSNWMIWRRPPRTT
ncbi:hypothetical protein BS78_K275900 [Paspalum vaginatum]|nr:hypothetical protein BS78_K275900 [Paspalum vaginatum]